MQIQALASCSISEDTTQVRIGRACYLSTPASPSPSSRASNSAPVCESTRRLARAASALCSRRAHWLSSKVSAMRRISSRLSSTRCSPAVAACEDACAGIGCVMASPSLARSASIAVAAGSGCKRLMCCCMKLGSSLGSSSGLLSSFLSSSCRLWLLALRPICRPSLSAAARSVVCWDVDRGVLGFSAVAFSCWIPRRGLLSTNGCVWSVVAGFVCWEEAAALLVPPG